MSLTDLTPAVDALLRPWAGRLAGNGISAAMVTAAGTALCTVLGAATAAAGAPWYLMWVLVLGLAARLATARLQALLTAEHGRGSLASRLLDEACRPLAEVSLLWPLVRVEGLAAWLVVLACLLALLTELAGLAVMTIGAERRTDGPLDAAGRGAAQAAVCVLLGLGVGPGWWTWVWFQVLPFLQAWTIARRLREGLRQAGYRVPLATEES